MSRRVVYSHYELASAVATSHSWRGVLRALGRSATSASTLRSVRSQVDALGIDHSHFTGQRRWSDDLLRNAVSASRTWTEVLQRLGVSSGNHVPVRAHALRLNIDTSHIGERIAAPAISAPDPQIRNLRTAGPTLAAGWFMLREYEISWPLEPCRYDLVIRRDNAFHRVQVKTATFRGDGGFMAQLSNSRRPGHRDLYDVDEIDSFFIIDADLNAYWIPYAAVAGYGRISLRGYRKFLVAEHGKWLSAAKDGAG